MYLFVSFQLKPFGPDLTWHRVSQIIRSPSLVWNPSLLLKNSLPDTLHPTCIGQRVVKNIPCHYLTILFIKDRPTGWNKSSGDNVCILPACPAHLPVRSFSSSLLLAQTGWTHVACLSLGHKDMHPPELFVLLLSFSLLRRKNCLIEFTTFKEMPGL